MLIVGDPTLGPPPSYSTLRRYMTAQALRPAPRMPTPDTPGATVAAHRRAQFEVRSFDDCSRLACHLQWYLDETAEALAHGLAQACGIGLLGRPASESGG